MNNMETDDILKSYPIISDQVDIKELTVLLRELEVVLRSGANGSCKSPAVSPILEIN